MLKLLIIDDEEPVRKGLAKFIENKGYPITIIGSVTDGNEALEIIDSENPDIILTDVVMPGMKGTELAMEIKKRKLPVKIIMISGYNDSDYLKQAIKYDAIDYILKPIDLDELKAVFEKVISLCEEELKRSQRELELQRKLTESLPVLREKFLHRLIGSEPLSIDFIKSRMQFLEMDFLPVYDHYTVAIVDIDNYLKHFGNFNERDRQMINLSISSDIQSLLGRGGVVFNKDNDEFVCIVHFSSMLETGSANRELSKFVNRMKERIEREHGISLTVGIGEWTDNIGGVGVAYKSAAAALQQKFVLGKGTVIYYKDIYPAENSNYIINESDKKEFTGCIRIADKEGCNEAIDRIFNGIRSMKGYSKSNIQSIYLSLISLTLSNLLELGINTDKVYDYKGVPWDEILEIETIEDMENRIKEFADEVINQINTVRDKNNAKTTEQIKYILETRYRDFVTLQLLSDELNLSPNYISALFKKETGENVIDYLKSIRMNKSMEMLRNTDIKIQDIAKEVGYDNPNYFTKIFRKFFGISPTECRERL